MPAFPDFKPVALEDRAFISERLREYQPETSELNFTNMFIWRSHYGFSWSVYKEWLLVIGDTGNGVQALPPVGPPSRIEVTRMLLGWLRDEKGIAAPRIDRADGRLVAELAADSGFVVEPTRDHFDYTYRTEDLANLAGGAYRAKRNHINYLVRERKVDYAPLGEAHVDACLKLAENWCEVRRCEDDLNLLGEWDATREALAHFRALDLAGGVLMSEGRVEAFTLGELLNRTTAVVHIEKANTEIRGLYALINQQFCEKQWKETPFVNREQDLGEPGLREAKQSYNPAHMVEKYRIRLAEKG
jgi:hypothetical protein